MTIDDQIRDEKLQHDINREAAKLSSLTSGKIHKYEYLTGKDILPSSNQQIIEQAKFTYSPLGKAFNKQIKNNLGSRKKKVDALNTLKSDNNKKLEIKNKNINPKSTFANDEATEEFNKIRDIEENIDREKLLYKAGNNTFDFRKFKTIRTFGKDIYEGKITLEEADEDQSDLTNESDELINKTQPKNDDKKQEKKIVIKNLRNFFNAREMVLNAFKKQNISNKIYRNRHIKY